MLETEDIDTVASTLRIRKAALERMIQDDAVPVSDAKAAAKANPIAAPVDAASTDDEPVANEKQGRYSPEFKAAALAMMEEKGAVATIRELGGQEISVTNDNSCWYWTSTEDQVDPQNRAWLCSMGTGGFQQTPKTERHRARAIVALNY